MKGIIFDIKHFAVHDGPGIRQTIFLKGCPLRCSWCHNPESQLATIEQVSIEEKVGIETFNRTKAVGKEISVQELLFEIEKDVQFFDESGGGVTFSGGEPMHQIDFLTEMIKECKKREIHVAIDTSGYAPEKSFERVLPLTDLFLFDLKLVNRKQHEKYTGVDNQIINKNLKLLDERGKKVIVRLPLIPDITTTEENLKEVADLMNSLKNISEINILPYHDISVSKYHRFNKIYTLGERRKMDNQEVEKINSFFHSRGLISKIEK